MSEIDDLAKRIRVLEQRVTDATEPTRPVAEWCHAVVAVLRAEENKARERPNRWKAMGTKATGEVEKMVAFADGIAHAHAVILDIPGWSGYEQDAPDDPNNVLHHALEKHEKEHAAAEARLASLLKVSVQMAKALHDARSNSRSPEACKVYDAALNAFEEQKAALTK